MRRHRIVALREPSVRFLREAAGRDADAPVIANGSDEAKVEAVPAARDAAVEAVGVPEDGKAAAVRGRPPHQVEQVALRRGRREAEESLLAERHVHRGERDLDEAKRAVGRDVPGPERMRDPRTEAGRVGEPERRVEREPEPVERREVPMRVETEVVVPLAGHGTAERLERLLLLEEETRVVGRRVAPVQAELAAAAYDAQRALQGAYERGVEGVAPEAMELLREFQRKRVAEIRELAGTDAAQPPSGQEADVVAAANAAIAASRDAAALMSRAADRELMMGALSGVAGELALIRQGRGEDPSPHAFVTGLDRPPNPAPAGEAE